MIRCLYHRQFWLLLLPWLLIFPADCKPKPKPRVNKRHQEPTFSDISFSPIFDPIAPNSLGKETSPQVSVFLHAAVGIFNKRRGNGTWGYGEDILKEMLHSINSSGLLEASTNVYIGLLGNSVDRSSAKDVISVYSSKARVIVEADNLYFAEFPTLYMIENYTRHFAHDDTLVLYMHSKGMRNNQAGGGPDSEGIFSWEAYSKQPAHSWRRYMQYFLVEQFAACHVLLREYGYYTVGVLKQGLPSLYAGNFWWSITSWLKKQFSAYSLKSLEWNMGTRMKAEGMLMKGVSEDDSNNHHYCIHHTHHNMYDCITHRDMYKNVRILPPRKNADCFSISKEKHRVNEREGKQGTSNCYLMGEKFPEIDDA